LIPGVVGWRRAAEEAPSYTGPLDLVPGAVVAYSQRAMAAAYVGNAIAVRKDGGSTVNFTTAVGNAVDAAAVIAHLDGEDGFIPTWYDQSGNVKNVIQATESKQPLWKASAANSKPAFTFSQAAEQFLATVGNVSFATNAFTFFVVSKGAAAGNNSFILGENTNVGSEAAGPTFQLDIAT